MLFDKVDICPNRPAPPVGGDLPDQVLPQAPHRPKLHPPDPDCSNPTPETPNPDTPNSKLDTPRPTNALHQVLRSHVLPRQPQSLNQKPKTRKPKPVNRNPKTEDRTPKTENCKKKPE